MEKKAFLIDFEAALDIRGKVQIEAETPELARKLALKIIKRNLETEECLIELGAENGNQDNITILEMVNSKAVNITDTMPLN